MHTEEEAKKLWCPMGRASNVNETAAVNRQRDGDPDPWCLCIASACMAWRWAQKPNLDWKRDNDMMFPPRDTRFDQPPYIEDRERGRCGLAGQP